MRGYCVFLRYLCLEYSKVNLYISNGKVTKPWIGGTIHVWVLKQLLWFPIARCQSVILNKIVNSLKKEELNW